MHRALWQASREANSEIVRDVIAPSATGPKQNIVGQEGDQLWCVFEVIAPTFLVAMAGT